jgi:hypothetical protein
MPKVRKAGLDAATERQAIASSQWLIELRGGLSRKHSQDYWRFSTKAELCGQVEAGERFVQGIKNALAKKHGEVSIYFLPGSGEWNEKLATKLIADAKQGDADANQVLREVAAEYLQRRIPLPDELAGYYSQQANSSKKQSHKTDYRDWILALTVDDIVRHFKLYHTRNRATQEHCACSIVAKATKLSYNTVQNAWDDYKGIADQRTETNYVAQAMVFLTSDPTRSCLVRFPRVGSIEAMPRPKRQRSRNGQI